MQRRDRRRGSSGGRATRRERRCNAMEKEGEGFDGEETGRSGGVVWRSRRKRGGKVNAPQGNATRRAKQYTESTTSECILPHFTTTSSLVLPTICDYTSFSGIRFSLNFPSPYPLSRITSSRTWSRDEVCRGPMFSINFSRGCNFLTFSAYSISVDLG